MSRLAGYDSFQTQMLAHTNQKKKHFKTLSLNFGQLTLSSAKENGNYDHLTLRYAD